MVPLLSRKVALLYVTCDDFHPFACDTLLRQRGVVFDLFVLDDSVSSCARQRIDDWAAAHREKVRVVRRPDGRGFKGGNINHWLDQFGDPQVYPYLLLVDADEHVPSDLAYRLVAYLESGRYAFVQACHRGTAELRTPLQKLLHPQVECSWRYSAVARQVLGIAPALGHGVLFRTERLRAIGGFPDVVSEDLGLTIQLAARGEFGLIVSDIVGEEAFPPTYRAYWRRRWRWIQADTEIVRTLLPTLWHAPIGIVRKLDLSMREARLSAGSLYWGLLALMSLLALFSQPSGIFLPPFLWVTAPLLIVPALPALAIKRLPCWRRVAYVLGIVFVGATTVGMHPPATAAGLRMQPTFVSTGSQKASRTTLRSTAVLFWDGVTALLFMTAGFSADNCILAAIGLAIGCSVSLRTRIEVVTLAFGICAFWLLVSWQVVADLAAGAVPIEHLLVLSGITITLD